MTATMIDPNAQTVIKVPPANASQIAWIRDSVKVDATKVEGFNRNEAKNIGKILLALASDELEDVQSEHPEYAELDADGIRNAIRADLIKRGGKDTYVEPKSAEYEVLLVSSFDAAKAAADAVESDVVDGVGFGFSCGINITPANNGMAQLLKSKGLAYRELDETKGCIIPIAAPNAAKGKAFAETLVKLWQDAKIKATLVSDETPETVTA